MTGHTYYNPRQRGPVHRVRGRSITAREMDDPPSQAKVVLQAVDKFGRLPTGERRVNVSGEMAIRLINEQIAMKREKVERMRLQVEGLLRSIEATTAEIAAIEEAD